MTHQTSKRLFIHKNATTKINLLIEENLWNFRNESESILEARAEALYDKVKNIGDFGKYVAKNDFCYALDPMDKIYQKFSREEFFDHVNTELFTFKKFEYYYPIIQSYDFPSGIKIGHCESVEFDRLPKKIQEFFEGYWKKDVSDKPEQFRNEVELLTNRKKYLFLKLELETIGYLKADYDAFQLTDESLHILRFLYKRDFSTLEAAFLVDNEKIFVGGMGGISTGLSLETRYSSSIKEKIEILSYIFTKESPSELEGGVKKAIIIYGISTSIYYDEVQLTLLCSALEALLLDESDRDYLGWKLAERVAFLLQTQKRRSEINKEVIRLYRKRSGFIHQKREQMVDENDVKSIQFIVVSMINRFMELRKMGYETLKTVKGKKSIVELIDSLKFE